MALCKVAAGELRHPVAIEQKIQARGTMGEVIEDWQEVARIRCKIWQSKGREAEEARRETGKAEIRFYARFVPGIKQGMRAVFDGRYFDIVNVNNLGELNRELELNVIETI